MAICEKHGEYEQEMMEMPWGAIVRSDCPECVKEHEEAMAKEEERDRLLANQSRLERANIEPAYTGCTIDTFNADTPERTKARDTVAAFISAKKGKLVLLGKNGTGKTHLAVACVQALGGKLLTVYEIATRIRATYTARAKEDELDIVDELAKLPFLAIDEIGRTKGSEAETNWLSYIIDKRHVRGLPTMLISNKHTRKTCKDGGCQNCLENYLDSDIISRLAEDGNLLTFEGEDYRRIKRGQA